MDALAYGTLTTPVGTIGVITSELGVARVGWQLENPGRLPDADVDPILREALKQLGEYFAAERRTFDVPLAGIPARGIGAVMAGNRLPIVIPCHRIVAANGLGGYSGGDPGHELETKRWLMELEGSLSPRLF